MTTQEKKELTKEAKSIPMNHFKRVDSKTYKYVERNGCGIYAYNDKSHPIKL